MPTQIDTSSNADANPLVALAPSDASAIVVYYGSSGPMLATAQMPYTSWSVQAIGIPTPRNAQALAVNSDDSLDILVTSPANGTYYFHYTRSGNAWSAGTNGTITAYEAGVSGQACAAWIGRDPQGRIWATGIDDVLATYQLYCDYSSDGGVSWIAASVEPTDLGEQNRHGLAAAIIGNDLVIVYDTGSGGLSYVRLDVHGASLGSWSSPAPISGIADVSPASVLSLAAIPGTATGVLVYNGSNGISALVYDAASDTWSSPTVLSSSTSDQQATLIPGPSGTIFALWSQFVASMSYALVYKQFHGTAWDATPTTIEASGSNLHWVHGTALSDQLAIVYTAGTASPFSIDWDTASLAVQTTRTWQTRLRLAVIVAHAWTMRFRLAATEIRFFSTRFRLGLPGRQFFSSRFRLLTAAHRSFATRLKLGTPGPSACLFGCRFRLVEINVVMTTRDGYGTMTTRDGYGTMKARDGHITMVTHE